MDGKHKKRNITFLLCAVFVAYAGQSIYGYIFNNYLEDVHKITAGTRGILEFPRELPGILALFAVGALFFLRENSIASIATLLSGLGMGLLAINRFSISFPWVVTLIIIASTGQHIFMVIVDAIVIHASKPENRSVRLGQMRALITGAGLTGAVYLWLKWKLTPAGFACDFIIAGILAVSASILLLGIKTDSFPKHKSWKERFVFKKKYSIYYMLEIFFGARKQVFMTFGFWVMVAVLKKSPEFIGKVMLCAGVLGIFFKPFVGKLVQKYSERKVLIIDGILLFFICMLYAFSMEIFKLQTATLIISACFVFDNLLFAVSTARASYIAGIAEKKEDITPSLYSGMALNHISSILGAVIGGYIWHLTSYSWTFVFTAVLAVCSSLTALKIKYRRETPA